MDRASAEEMYREACRHIREGSYTQALALLDRISQSYPGNPQLSSARSACLEHLGISSTASFAGSMAAVGVENTTVPAIPRVTGQGTSWWLWGLGSVLAVALVAGFLAVSTSTDAIHAIAPRATGLEGTLWTWYGYKCAFGPPPRLQVTWKDQTQMGTYVLDGQEIQLAAFGHVESGIWDGKSLVLGRKEAESLGRHTQTFPPPPAQTFVPGTWHILMASQVADGGVLGMCDAFAKHNLSTSRAVVLGQDEPATGFEDLRLKLSQDGCLRGAADRPTVYRELDRLAGIVGPQDAVFILFASHMSPDGMDIGLSFEELDACLEPFPEGVLKVVFLEGCGSGGALKWLRHADIVYTSTTANEGSFGAFLTLYSHALLPKFLFGEADKDGNGIVTLGEAFDVASNKQRIAAHYHADPLTFNQIPQRATREPGLDYTVSFVSFAVRIYPEGSPASAQ